MTRDTVALAVRGVLELALGRRIEPDEEVPQMKEPGWDSVKHIEILFLLEEELGITFAADEIAALDGMRAIVEYAAAHLAAT